MRSIRSVGVMTSERISRWNGTLRITITTGEMRFITDGGVSPNPRPVRRRRPWPHTVGTVWANCTNQVASRQVRDGRLQKMDQGTGTPATIPNVFQFAIAPTDLAGTIQILVTATRANNPLPVQRAKGASPRGVGETDRQHTQAAGFCRSLSWKRRLLFNAAARPPSIRVLSLANDIKKNGRFQ